jgi:cation transport ATPase
VAPVAKVKSAVKESDAATRHSLPIDSVSIQAGTVKDPEEDLPAKGSPYSKENIIAVITLVGIGLHLVFRFLLKSSPLTLEIPLLGVLILGGVPLVYDLAHKALHKEFGSDLLAGISIITSAFLGEYLAGSLVVLMLSGGRVMES